MKLIVIILADILFLGDRIDLDKYIFPWHMYISWGVNLY